LPFVRFQLPGFPFERIKLTNIALCLSRRQAALVGGMEVEVLAPGMATQPISGKDTMRVLTREVEMEYI
jgi:hypothetical protein